MMTLMWRVELEDMTSENVFKADCRLTYSCLKYVRCSGIVRLEPEPNVTFKTVLHVTSISRLVERCIYSIMYKLDTHNGNEWQEQIASKYLRRRFFSHFNFVIIICKCLHILTLNICIAVLNTFC